jgi:aspartate carbamoyltransferase regulatory subunit
MEKILSVAAIERGSVVDHIPAGQGMRIVRLLKLASHQKKVTLGLNLPSKSMGYKDIIKVEEREITEEEAKQIAIFAPRATINYIVGYLIVKKFTVSMPTAISQLLSCPNHHCITNHEDVATHFKVYPSGRIVNLQCNYCEKSFAHDTC